VTVQEPDTFQSHPKVPRELKAGHVFVTLDEEFDNFDTETEVYQKAPDLDSDFVPYRLRMGTYGQRQENMQMMRIKLPYGGVTAEQMDALAEVAEKHSGMRRGHITTRENFQFHFVPLEQASAVMRILAEAGLSTREACGHTVRNVTGCPYAGVTDHQLFDVTPYLAAYARSLIRNPICQNMPRKWKTSFSCGPIDCAGSPIHDMGFIAAVREENGEEVRGFKIVVGGGTSTMVRAAETLWEFARADDGQYIRVAEAALKVFDKEGGFPNFLRKNMNKARVKFLVKKLGIGPRLQPLGGDERRPAAAARLRRRHGDDPPRQPLAGAVPRRRRRHASLQRWQRAHAAEPEPRSALGARGGPAGASRRTEEDRIRRP